MRNKQLNIRVSEQEYNQIVINADILKLSISSYILKCVCDTNITYTPSRVKEKSQIIASVNHFGNNLNQIAHNLNIANNKNELSSIDYKKLLDTLNILENDLKEILERF